ncbi:hypothetical protein [Acinetobacter tianfuensis]|uniref:Uncharacterized protein n=1 Tax=Acinetobacter tianfuensis TaxID=2419603 RepID=A0A3A8EVD4_9GAMM|nr:hypothetical protein [Acinetobacter tianfuensis]RKG32811.1 hypothetical protein D7V32_04920 [Acinetobacter tianfuensis]
MSYTIFLKIQPETHQRFMGIYQKINDNNPDSVAKPLGDTLADIACDIIDQVFGNMAKMSSSNDHESEKIIQQVTEMTRKYMPWSVSFFGNDRLKPMVNYLYEMTVDQNSDTFVTYPVDNALIAELMGCVEQMKQGNNQYVPTALKAFTEVVDQGVTHLVRKPKKMLKFNVVVDKTLNGVINLTTQLGYKRFDKLGSMYDAAQISLYFDHFVGFIQKGQSHG